MRPVAVPEALLPPGLRDRFDEVRLLGEGGCGRVVLAEDRELSRLVAVKLLLPAGLASRDFRARFDREARLTARIRSPHVAGVYAFDIEAPEPYILYEYVEGPTLYERVMKARHGRIPVDEAGRLLREILVGLAALHELGIVHRDLKPRNVVLRGGATAVLIDLGLGRGQKDETLTKTGLMLGTPAFMPPQQMLAEDSEPTWDVYAAALTYFLMVSGETPFAGTSFPEVYNAKVEGVTRGLRDRGFAVPEGIEALVVRSLSGDPGDRPRDAGAMLEALDEVLPVPVSVVAAPPRIRVVPPAKPRGGPAVAIGAAALLVVLGGVGWRLTAGDAPAARGPEPTDLAPPAPEPLPAVEALERFARELEEDPAIQETLALVSESPQDRSREVWRQARAAFKTLVRDHRLAGVVGILEATPLETAWVTRVARLGLIERLLARSTLPGEAPLYREGEDPGLDRLLGRALQVREEPSMGGLPDPEGFRPRRKVYELALSAGGRRWETLRSFESMIPEDEPALGPIDSVRILNPDDVAFDRSVKGQELLLDDFYGSSEAKRFARSPTEVVAALQPFQGDLILALGIHGWGPTAHLWLEVGGARETSNLVMTPPPLPGPTKVGDANVRQGVLLRVARDALPAEPRRVRLTVRALAPLSSPKAYAEVQELLQLVRGPPPAAFAALASGTP